MMGRLGSAGAPQAPADVPALDLSAADELEPSGTGLFSPAAAPPTGYEEFKATPPCARPSHTDPAAAPPRTGARTVAAAARELTPRGEPAALELAAAAKADAAKRVGWEGATPADARRPATISTTPLSGSQADSPVEPREGAVGGRALDGPVLGEVALLSA